MSQTRLPAEVSREGDYISLIDEHQAQSCQSEAVRINSNISKIPVWQYLGGRA